MMSTDLRRASRNSHKPRLNPLRNSHRAYLLLIPLFLLVNVASIASSLGQSAAAIQVEDDEGRVISLERPAQRIISLAPSLTELLFAAGAGDQVIAAVEYSDFPDAANSLPRIGRHDLLDMERILALEPDLIVAWQSGNPRASVNRLREFGLTVYTAEPKRLADIPGHLLKLGALAGTEAIARAESERFSSTLSELEARYLDAREVRTFYQIWNQPLMTAGGNELINDIITLCGGENVFAELNLIAPKVSVEAVLLRDPEVIIASGMDEERPEWLDEWRQWPNLTAVAQENLFFIPPDLLQRHTPRALEGLQQMCAQLEAVRAR